MGTPSGEVRGGESERGRKDAGPSNDVEGFALAGARFCDLFLTHVSFLEVTKKPSKKILNN